MLIRLFEDKDKVRWGPPAKGEPVNNWFVLKDEQRSGCLDQRDFVRKALNTPDFAILEGPPGSGKTTVILELICQITAQGKRVLLCGSTNVSIDNILERLIEKKDSQKSLLEHIDLLPVRIGKAERVDPNIAAYQIDNLLDDYSEGEREWRQRLLLEAANMVCGTTMGIINHPKFRERGGGVYGLTYSGDTPIVPEFDYLIIDESSKTTFQEFLVPALYAKRWILAGDIMQLSPFTDAENIEFNFEQLSMGKNERGKFEVLDINIQKAVFYLEKLRSYCFWNDRMENKSGINRFIFPTKWTILEKMLLELANGKLDQFRHETIVVFIVKEVIELEVSSDNRERTEKWNHENVLIRTPENLNFLELVAANIIFVDFALFEVVKDKLPATHAILQRPDWESMPHAFYHNAIQQEVGFRYYNRERLITNSFEIVEEINKEFRERGWAQELAWRVDSEHQLRLANESRRKESLTRQIDDLTPFSVDKERFEEARNLVAAMSFPSILESLVTGIKGKKPRKPSTITEGFKDDDLKTRKTTLVFQHRMHPEISAFPRERFYRNADALRDLERPRHISENRQWGYSHYDKRSVWVDVKSPTKGSTNIYEIEEMMRHLQDFLNYAIDHPQPEGKDWEVACLAFYRGQERLIREGGEKKEKGIIPIDGLRAITDSKTAVSNFEYNRHKTKGPYPVHIRLHSVDRFQGHEADVVFLSMSQTQRDGFLDNPNRLNVSITRAKFQLVIFGRYEYFSKDSRSEDLKALANSMPVLGNKEQ
jgi:RecA/RadA recombinase